MSDNKADKTNKYNPNLLNRFISNGNGSNGNDNNSISSANANNIGVRLDRVENELTNVKQRVEILEGKVDNLSVNVLSMPSTYIKWIVGLFIAGVLSFITLIITLFVIFNIIIDSRIDSRFTQMDSRFTQVDSKFQVIDFKLDLLLKDFQISPPVQQ